MEFSYTNPRQEFYGQIVFIHFNFYLFITPSIWNLVTWTQNNYYGQMFFCPFHLLILHSWKSKTFNQQLHNDMCNPWPRTYNHIIFQMLHMHVMVPQDVPLKYQCDYDQLRAETIMQNMEVMHTLGLPTTTPKQVFISFSYAHLFFWRWWKFFFVFFEAQLCFFLKRCKFYVIHICLFKGAISFYFILWSTFVFFLKGGACRVDVSRYFNKKELM